MEPKTAILIVDDEPVNRLILKRLLKDSKHTLLEASNGNEALEVFVKAVDEGYKIRAIIMDYMMPGLNGDRALTGICQYHEKVTGKTMRQQDFTTAIMFTANHDYIRHKCPTCDKCAVLVKYKPDDLMGLKSLVE
jgi:CheY-like chemotaxis protein